MRRCMGMIAIGFIVEVSRSVQAAEVGMAADLRQHVSGNVSHAPEVDGGLVQRQGLAQSGGE